MSYGEQVCKTCSEESEQYDQLTKQEVASQYLLTDSTIRMMKFQERNNPRNSNWAMMKLYLRKHAITQALDRWGSLAALQIEIEKRNTDKVDKQTAAVSSLFSTDPLTKKAEKLTAAKRRKLNMAAIVANMQGKTWLIHQDYFLINV